MSQKGIMSGFVAERLDFYGFWAAIFFLVTSSAAADYRYEACAPKMCGNVSISYPFYVLGEQEPYCAMSGLNGVNCSNPATPILYIPELVLVIDTISYDTNTLRVHVEGINRSECLPVFKNMSIHIGVEFPVESYLHFLSNCSAQLPGVLMKYTRNSCAREITGIWDLVMLGDDENLGMAMAECKTNVVIPVEAFPGDEENGVVDYVGLLEKGVMGNWTAYDCKECMESGGRCGVNTSASLFQCFCPDRPHRVKCQSRNNHLPLILGSVGAALVAILVLSVAICLICRRKKGIKGPYFLSRNYSKQSSKLDVEEGSVYLGVSLFTYSELREATKNFDASKELGDGGFGTVYHGKLQDGREVAVKRLYEHNFKRLEQFMNEIEILTRLRHPNLVALYGCTSRRSRELLLVYEYIPNGTIADHLHGDRADHKYLKWSHRMSIAIETADALSYLHASDIIHRDVKTTNILLDHNFCVKVADFGLSRLFPLDVTHVSTAPQGTPGYVDPEYHQCYHLTDKSDVYSFGVVLVELISSMPAVDMNRHRHEINLANLAINRIQRCAFDELIDPSLGYKTDPEVMRMTTSVAELAFQCLQGEKEMRPSMVEVLQTLRDIKNFKRTSVENLDTPEDVKDSVSVFSPEAEDRVLLKNAKFPSSPVSVTQTWVSSSTSASTSSN